MTPYWAGEDVTLYLGKCEDVLPGLPANSVDAIVTDPPYGLADIAPETVIAALTAWLAGDRLHVPDGRGFMGREWDKFVPPPGAWDEAYRVLKPGGHMLCFAAPRTVDLMGLSIRLAGFRVMDSIDWIYGQGFPKSRDVSKAIDAEAGAAREVIGVRDDFAAKANKQRIGVNPFDVSKADGAFSHPEQVGLITAPATEEAARWEGWGTALKPSHEPIVLARKPLEGTVAGNVLKWGCGAINISGTRVRSNGSGASSGGGQADTGGCPIHPVRDLRDGDEETPLRGGPAEVAEYVRAQMPGQADVRAAESQLAGRQLDGQAHWLPDGQHLAPLAGGPGSAADSVPTGLPGTPAGHGASDGTPAAGRRDGAPRQRDQGRQPAGEPASYGLGKPLAGASPDRAGNAQPAVAEHAAYTCTCAAGTAPVTEGRWPSNVVFTHSASCEPAGTRRVRSGGGTNGKPGGNEILGAQSHARPRSDFNYADADGLETVTAWVCAPDCPVGELDRQSGVSTSTGGTASRPGGAGYGFKAIPKANQGGLGDTGGASRFYPVFRYQAKAPASERPRLDDGTAHETVKPLGLMSWLVRLITPPGGTVLDPFAGSGPTAEACIIEGFRAVLVEQDPKSAALIRKRLSKPIQPVMFGLDARGGDAL